MLLWALSFVSTAIIHGWGWWVALGITGYSAFQMTMSDDDYFDEDA